MLFKPAASLAVFLAACTPAALGAGQGMVLTSVSTSGGAACLDGSTPAAYLDADFDARIAATRSVVIFLQGGGWVNSPTDAVSRSKTRLGSNSTWSQVLNGRQGMLSPNATENPSYADWGHVYVPYCDGASFSGTIEQPINVDGTLLYVRGRANLEASLALVQSRLPRGVSMKNVVLTGSSAGGLATILHADTVASTFSDARVIAVPQSGFFVDYPNIKGQRFYRSWMSWVYKWSGASAGVNAACVAALGDERCFLAEHVLPHVRTPVFLLQSRFDAWQVGNVMQLQLGGPSKCVSSGPTECSASQVEYAVGFSNAIVSVISSAFPAGGKDGAFVSACWTHGTFQYEAGFNNVAINGTNAQEALAAWNTGMGSEEVFLIDCNNDSPGARTCNPTCHQ